TENWSELNTKASYSPNVTPGISTRSTSSAPAGVPRPPGPFAGRAAEGPPGRPPDPGECRGSRRHDQDDRGEGAHDRPGHATAARGLSRLEGPGRPGPGGGWLGRQLVAYLDRESLHHPLDPMRQLSADVDGPRRARRDS